MTRSRDELIAEITDDLTPVSKPGRLTGAIVLWWIASVTFVVLAMLAEAPFRPGAFAQLASHGRFALETAVGVAAGLLTIACALRLGIPEPAAWPRRIALAAATVTAWCAFYLAGLALPALEPSMLGKREACYLQVFFFALPPLAFGLFLLRRLAVIDRAVAAASVGAAAGAIPGLLMQLGCMYVPEHILTHHIAPIAVVAALGAVLGPLVLRRV